MVQHASHPMRTGLYSEHLALGAKMVSFAGWEMPLYYEGVIAEHRAVRQQAGVFDVSHMGRIAIEGTDAEEFLDELSVSSIRGKQNGTAIYTVWCAEDGMAVDDLIVYKVSPTYFFAVVNASNRQKDLNHLLHCSSGFRVTIREQFEEGILALQGPVSKALAATLFPDAAALPKMRFTSFHEAGEQGFLSATGYTGEEGFEFYAPMPAIVSLWRRLLHLGWKQGVRPVGLGARDTLRLEMGYALYGHELSDSISPAESVSRWTIDWNKPKFVGKEALARFQEGGGRREYGIVLSDRAIAREGYPVFKDGMPIGRVTSGTLSPCLNRPIAIILVDAKLEFEETVEVEIRGRKSGAQVVKLPFLDR